MNPNKEYYCGKMDKIVKIKECCHQGKCEFRMPTMVMLDHKIKHMKQELDEVFK